MESVSLTSARLSLVDFSQIKEVLTKVGIATSKDGDSETEHLFLSNDELLKRIKAKCEGCGTEIALNNLGHIVHGSKLVYCKNPDCFNHYLANKKIR